MATLTHNLFMLGLDMSRLWRWTLCACLCVLFVGCKSEESLKRVEKVDGTIREVGTVKNGKKHGQWQTYFDNGRRIFEVSHWADGRRHGPFRIYNENGTHGADGNFVRGVIDGRYRGFYDDGQIAEIVWYNHGQRERLWCEWHPDGRLQRIAEYNNDKLVREEHDPPGACPLLLGEGKRHLDISDIDEW